MHLTIYMNFTWVIVFHFKEYDASGELSAADTSTLWHKTMEEFVASDNNNNT